MGFGLRGLNRLAGSDLLDRIRIRKQVERALFTGHQERLPHGDRRRPHLQGRPEAGQTGAPGAEQAARPLRPHPRRRAADVPGRRAATSPRTRSARAAKDADADCATPPELLAQATELGVNMLGVPEELGGVMHEQAAVTSVLIGEALAHGDMGIAYAALAPGAVATAIGLWGSDRAGGDLPARLHRRGRRRPRRWRSLEPRPLFDPLKLETTAATRDGDDWVLDGVKSLVARAAPSASCSSSPPRPSGAARRCSWSSPAPTGSAVEAEPAMGLRAAATGRLLLEGVRVPARALLGEGDARGLRRVRAALADRLVRARGRHRRRPCSTT